MGSEMCIRDRAYDLRFVFSMLAIIFIFILIIMLIVMVCVYIPSESNKKQNEERYKALIYKATTESVKDEFGIINKEYIDEIQDWNEDLTGYKELTNNFWVGIFIPDWVNEFKTIDLDKIEMKE